MRIILSILVLSVCYSQDCEEGVVADDCGICGGNIFIIESEYFEYVCEDVTTCEEEWVCNNAIVGYNEQSRCNSPTGSFCTSEDQ